VKLDVNDRSKLLQVINSCVGTKFISRWSDLACTIALDAVNTVSIDENGRKEIDIKRYAKVEKVLKYKIFLSAENFNFGLF
jgi:T-complex protein 1 subunit gamma